LYHSFSISDCQFLCNYKRKNEKGLKKGKFSDIHISLSIIIVETLNGLTKSGIMREIKRLKRDKINKIGTW